MARVSLSPCSVLTHRNVEDGRCAQTSGFATVALCDVVL